MVAREYVCLVQLVTKMMIEHQDKVFALVPEVRAKALRLETVCNHSKKVPFSLLVRRRYSFSLLCSQIRRV